MKNLKVDVAIVGTGAAGMTAALSAAEGGATVAMFDKRGVAGGVSNIPVGGILSVESKHQREKNYPGTRDQVFRLLTDFSHWRGNARLIRAFVDKSGDTIDWLEKQGVEFEELPSTTPAPAYPGGVYCEMRIKGYAAALMKALRAEAKEKGVTTYLKTLVKKINKEGNRVTGLTALDPSWEDLQVEARAVVIATGGFVNNKEMVKKYCGYDLGKDMFPFIDLENTGDGIRMAWEAGATRDGMGMHIYYGVPKFLIPKTLLHLISVQPYLWLNQKGERFIDESIGNPVYIGNALARQPNRCAYLIFDDNTRKYLEEKGVDRKSPWMDIERIEDVEGEIRTAIRKGIENLYIAGSLEELAKAIGINPEAMKKSLAEYNRYCAQGRDDFFNKDPKFLHEVKAPNFYAFRIRAGSHGTIGGIKINERAEVLDKRDESIPGLYSAGYDACCIYGDPTDYNWFVPGGTYSFALNSGRIAGENAAEYVKALRASELGVMG